MTGGFDKMMNFLNRRCDKFKFGDKVTWGQLSKKGNLKFAKRAVVVDFTISQQVGVVIYTESPVEHREVDVDEVVKGWVSRRALKKELLEISKKLDGYMEGC